MPKKVRTKPDQQYLRRVGRNMHAIRKQSGLNQKQISSCLKLSRKGYRNYEAGEREIGILALKALINATGVNPLDLSHFDKRKNFALPSQPLRKPQSWPRSVRRWRANLVAARGRFDQERYSRFHRLVNDGREVVFAGCLLAINLRLYGPNFAPDWLPQSDWSNLGLVLASFCVCGLMPLQVRYYLMFFRWKRTLRT